MTLKKLISAASLFLTYRREFQENIYACFFDSAETFDYVDQNKLCKIHQTPLPVSWKICMQVKKQQSMEQWTVSKLGKEYIKPV